MSSCPTKIKLLYIPLILEGLYFLLFLPLLFLFPLFLLFLEVLLPLFLPFFLLFSFREMFIPHIPSCNSPLKARI